MFRRISSAFTGGAIGALVDSFNIWVLGKAGITALLGVGMHPHFSGKWLYPRLVWGGLWGLLMLLPFSRHHLLNKGLIISLVPSAVMLFIVFPGMGKGMLGVGYGTLTPVLVVLLNFIWGVVTAIWYKHAKR